MSIDTSTLIKKFLEEVTLFVFYGLGIFAFIKAYLKLNAFRIVSFFRIYFYQKKFFDHQLFLIIQEIIDFRSEYRLVHSSSRKYLAHIIIECKLRSIAIATSIALLTIFKNNFLNYLKTYRKYSSEYIVNIFLNQLEKSKDLFISMLEYKILGNNLMTKNDFLTFIEIFEENDFLFEIFFFETLQNLKQKHNIYEVLFYILDSIQVLAEVTNRSIATMIQVMNGRLDGIKFNDLDL